MSVSNRMQALLSDVQQLERELDAALRQVTTLARANNEMCDELFEARQLIRKLEEEAQARGRTAA